MAYTTSNVQGASFFEGFFGKIGTILSAIGQSAYVARGFEARSQELQRLNAKTDEELAKMGLNRSEIPSYVFRDVLYV